MTNASSQEHPYTVSALTSALKATLEGGFSRIYVESEITGWKVYPSGHAYFTLKDSSAQISCVMFRSSLDRCKCAASLKDGAKVMVYGNVSVYAQRGNYQLIVLAAKLTGAGDLMQRYLELKNRLESEGIFAASRKRPLPFAPRRIGLVTSAAGAVVHDMCRVMIRRFPAIEVRIFPAQVQGVSAPPTLIAGIEYFNSVWRPDLVIIARGGGSFEDLFCFNDESLVRSVAASEVPVVSAVGHETDFTLCDFAADLRAGTPSMAAELAVPELAKLDRMLADSSAALSRALRGMYEQTSQRIDYLSDSLATAMTRTYERTTGFIDDAARRIPAALSVALERGENVIDRSAERLPAALSLALERSAAKLDRLSDRLSLLSPYSVLGRGYSLTTDESGAVVRDASRVAAGSRIRTRLAAGELISVVETDVSAVRG